MRLVVVVHALDAVFAADLVHVADADDDDVLPEELVQERRKGMPPISVSVGAAFWDRENPGPDILKDADKALLQMKQNGKLGCRIYGE